MLFTPGRVWKGLHRPLQVHLVVPSKSNQADDQNQPSNQLTQNLPKPPPKRQGGCFNLARCWPPFLLHKWSVTALDRDLGLLLSRLRMRLPAPYRAHVPSVSISLLFLKMDS